MQSVLNLEKLREITDGDAEIEAHLFSLYRDTAQRCLAKLQAAIDAASDDEWKKTAHELKGASANIRAEEMAALCKHLEHISTDEKVRKQALDELHAAYARVIALLQH